MRTLPKLGSSLSLALTALYYLYDIHSYALMINLSSFLEKKKNTYLFTRWIFGIFPKPAALSLEFQNVAKLMATSPLAVLSFLDYLPLCS
jgi:hypothetical protein